MNIPFLSKKVVITPLAVLSAMFVWHASNGQNLPKEQDYYTLTTLPTPEGVHLEGGGVQSLPNGSLAVATRRGDVWIIENPTMANGNRAIFKKFASGLHEPLGLAHKNGSLYTTQRGELTKLTDTNGDGIADEYRTIYAWPLSTHYHEYSFGPVLAPDNTFFVTTNVAFGSDEWWRGESRVPWRGWTMKITEDGQMEPWATGMRSPAGYGLIDGELFYADNQGDWVGSGGIWHLPKGVFTGHPAGLRWTQEPNSPVKLTEAEFYERIDIRQVKKNGRYVKPENIIDEKDPDFLYEVKADFSELQLPAVILPHGIMGISNSQLLVDDTNGKFGPFAGQLFIGDQGQSKIMRVVLEKVKGEYQGVAFDFRSGFQSGVMRMDFDSNGNLFAGETNRGWGSAGTTNSGLEFLTWTGRMPFEMKTAKAMPDGFEIEFTKPVDKSTAENLDSYSVKTYLYKYHPVYGSPQTNIEDIIIKGVKVSDDGLKVRLVTEKHNRYNVHEVTLQGIKSKVGGHPVLHPTFFYTMNNIPDGEKLPLSVLSTKRTKKTSKGKKVVSRKKKAATKKTAVLTDAQVQPLLTNNTCIACHVKDKRMVGPSFMAIAERGYSNEKIVELIYNPQPKNWPEYATPMAPMPQVPKEEALKIAAWINSLNK
ncbi:auracyanin family protein [Allomuricauda sp. SCSIO 65647]|uniref:auracyanin family protein n=1 Tax=Allomuricauda sp. SCSIO 65647 TaxID=2908843 RepID=UPI001F1605E1|nr:auracyanin family protein [Muricauda sp. SCSIO 65647]UJH66934.1 auracyanin family protein [Muricauda sp. SCSIO 65647]